jgi:hypothetical protein
MSKGSTFGKLATAATLIALATTGQAVAASATPRAVHYSVPGGQAALSGIQRYVTAHPGSFAGVWLDRSARTLVLVAAPAASSAAIAGVYRAGHATKSGPVAGRLAIRVTHAPYSMSRLLRVMSAVPRARPWARLARPYLASWYLDVRADRVVIGLTKVTAGLRQAASPAFGPLVKLVVTGRARPQVWEMRLPKRAPVVSLGHGGIVPAVNTCTRLLDCTPYWGGDRIVRESGDTVYQCTVSFTWTPNGHGPTFTIETTAGHCGSTGTTWSQGYYNTSNGTINTTGSAGKDTLTQWGNNRPDGELLSGGDWTPIEYPAMSGAGVTVGNYYQVVQGQGICSDGSFTGQNCSGVVQSADGCTTTNDNGTNVYVCHEAYATSASRLTQPGDSGGPVYAYESNHSYVDALGLISLGNTSGTELWFSDMAGLESGLGGVPTTA